MGCLIGEVGFRPFPSVTFCDNDSPGENAPVCICFSSCGFCSVTAGGIKELCDNGCRCCPLSALLPAYFCE